MPHPLTITKPKGAYVYIAGAGPGDVGLLTLKTYTVMQQAADVVVYDRLIPESILSLIPKGVKKVYAGKSCKKHHMTQEEINACLVKEASKGKVVLRLKGGDPFIFGRGGEEAQHLLKNHIPFEIIPGVNAADGCAAYLGIPLTHRELATGVRFITGHQQKGKPMALDWQSLADRDTTLVIYMGLANLGSIAKNLIKAGLPKTTPAVAIQEGTLSSQRTVFASLAALPKAVAEKGLEPPTLIIVGRVVKLAGK